MINPNELRIGNCIWDDTRQKIKFVNHRVISDLASHPEPLDYSPITLTPEWLERCGFKKERYTDGEFYWIKDETDYSSSPYNSQIPWKCYRMRVFKEDWYFELHENKSGYKPAIQKKCLFVHQLQNLYFALTGEELTIKETV